MHVIESVTEAGKTLAFRRRILLGLAFDFDSDKSMLQVAEIQAQNAQAPNTGNGRPAMSAIETNPYQQPSQLEAMQ